jgi:hypothetical protein
MALALRLVLQLPAWGPHAPGARGVVLSFLRRAALRTLSVCMGPPPPLRILPACKALPAAQVAAWPRGLHCSGNPPVGVTPRRCGHWKQ